LRLALRWAIPTAALPCTGAFGRPNGIPLSVPSRAPRSAHPKPKLRLKHATSEGERTATEFILKAPEALLIRFIELGIVCLSAEREAGRPRCRYRDVPDAEEPTKLSRCRHVIEARMDHIWTYMMCCKTSPGSGASSRAAALNYE
jgi:hypothetical protein